MITEIPNSYEMFKNIHAYFTSDSVDKILNSDGSNIKASEHCFSLFTTQIGCKIVVTYKSVDKIVKCDQPNESC